MLSIASNTALSGISMTKRVIDMISNNVSNSDTPGYRRLTNDNYELAPQAGSGAGVSTFISRSDNPLVDANLARARYKLAEEVAVQEGANAANVVTSNTNVDGAFTALINAGKDLQLLPGNAALQSVFEAAGADYVKAVKITKQGFADIQSGLVQKTAVAQVELQGLQRKLTDLSSSGSDGAYVEANYIKEQITTLQGTLSGYSKAMSQIVPSIQGAVDATTDAARTALNAANGADLIDASGNWVSGAANNLTGVAATDVRVFGNAIGLAQATAGSAANTSLLGVRYATADYTSAQSAADKEYGVDTASELIKLKQYENLYNANMQVFATSNEMLGTLLNIVAR